MFTVFTPRAETNKGRWRERYKISFKRGMIGTPLVVQWLRLCAPNAGVLGSIPGQGTRSHMHAATKSPCAATNTGRSQIKKYIF